MFPVAPRLAALAALVLFASSGGNSAVAASTGPAVLPAARIDGLDYLDLEGAAARMGLESRGRDGRKFVYADSNSRLVIDEGREVFVDGSRIFLGSPVLTRQGRLLVSRIDFERCLVPILAPWLLAEKPPLPKVIALDPGHGGTDNGMMNPRLKMNEKVFTLDVALRLKKILETAGVKVVLTRKDDRALSPDKRTDLRRRADIANRAKADLFVSIHFNALANDTKTGGTEVYTFTRQFQRSDASASFGSRDDTEPDDSPVNRHDAGSSLLGQSIKRALLAELGTMDRGSKTMHSGVLRGLNCPAVLVESVFLSNDAEARLVATPAYRQRIAQSIADGILRYGEVLESLRPKPAPASAKSQSAAKSR